jgi:hypothetical protein
MLSRENSTPADDPLTRLEFCKSEIDRLFGRGFSRDHPELTAAVMLSASLDFHGLALARAMRDIAGALLVEDAPAPGDGLFRPPTILR